MASVRHRPCYKDPPDRPRAIAARVNLRVESLQILREILLVARHRLAIHSRCSASLESTKRSFQGGYIDVMQQGSESSALVPPCCFADPRKIRWQSDPALRPDSGDLTQFSLRPTPSLRAPRFLRRPHRYYESVRLPASARRSTLLSPRAAPPPPTIATDPAGPPGFRWQPFERDAVHDPGGASPSRIATAHTRPSTTGTVSASTTFTISGLTTRTSLNPCLRFEPRVTATPARLGSGPARYGSGRMGLSPIGHHQLFPAHSVTLSELSDGSLVI